MIRIQANYYDGASSQRHHVELELRDNAMLQVVGEGVNKFYPLADIVRADRIGGRVRILRLRDNASLEVFDPAPLDAYLDRHGVGRGEGRVHRLERSLRYIALALAVTVAVSWGFLQWGVPALARAVAYGLPASTQELLGEGTLDVLDGFALQPTRLSGARQRQLGQRFRSLLTDNPEAAHYRLVFRSSEQVGANAFALPDGTVVITDQLIALARDDREVEAVLAHEIGHIHYRHALRAALQNSGAALLIALMTGDLASMSSFAASLPTFIVNLTYSRQFELEADGYARQLMQARGIPLIHFANILTRLSASHGSDDSEVAFLSSHPATAERVRAFQ